MPAGMNCSPKRKIPKYGCSVLAGFWGMCEILLK